MPLLRTAWPRAQIRKRRGVRGKLLLLILPRQTVLILNKHQPSGVPNDHLLIFLLYSFLDETKRTTLPVTLLPLRLTKDIATPCPSKMSAAFEKAVADSKKLTSKPSNEELLDLYGQ